MMEYGVICLVALIGSGLTLFSGFGLGTLLVPVFGIFFPIGTAITLTAIVHFLNNLFKLTLVGKHADKSVALRFGIPAIVCAFIGAYLLTQLTGLQPLFFYTMFNRMFTVTPINMVIAILLMVFALFEVLPPLANLQFSRKYMPLGGALSGFFGGLSGNQGALRSAFLIRAGLSKEAFVATGVVIAVFIDMSRLSVYANKIIAHKNDLNYTLVAAATLSAFLGAYFGNRLLGKVTVKAVQRLVTVMLFLFAISLGLGWI